MLKPINIIFILCTSKLFAQFPNTDVWIFKIVLNQQKKEVLAEPQNISNRNGYDNQPSFSNDSKKLFYVSMREDNQADIYQYDIRSKKQTQITRTEESEFSPVPFENDLTLTSVVVEKDSSQRLHFIDLITGNHIKRFEFDSVGYYTFVNTDTLVYYKLTQPHSLRFYAHSNQEDKFICANPIKSMHRINRQSFVFGINEQSKIVFYQYDFLLRKAILYAPGFADADATFWHHKWGLICAVGNKLMRYDETEKLWLTLFDLSQYGIDKIARFTLDRNNKYIAVVQTK